ncbi:hypothetical protein NEHOM01_0757 [Nematocida homosporus]|uniref:uncharacterized protein n=1 Tax=Nematocida homosporus TaxID=1912981 RepID=UPI002221189F|nr:uncharacterized protein NEHOM01_0757 [Nematocida homosporus]KAI5185299.1 hypothetical protein NEHOM01_0757 [Nematocida homosporus]
MQVLGWIGKVILGLWLVVNRQVGETEAGGVSNIGRSTNACDQFLYPDNHLSGASRPNATERRILCFTTEITDDPSRSVSENYATINHIVEKRRGLGDKMWGRGILSVTNGKALRGLIGTKSNNPNDVEAENAACDKLARSMPRISSELVQAACSSKVLEPSTYQQMVFPPACNSWNSAQGVLCPELENLARYLPAEVVSEVTKSLSISAYSEASFYWSAYEWLRLACAEKAVEKREFCMGAVFQGIPLIYSTRLNIMIAAYKRKYQTFEASIKKRRDAVDPNDTKTMAELEVATKQMAVMTLIERTALVALLAELNELVNQNIISTSGCQVVSKLPLLDGAGTTGDIPTFSFSVTNDDNVEVDMDLVEIYYKYLTTNDITTITSKGVDRQFYLDAALKESPQINDVYQNLTRQQAEVLKHLESKVVKLNSAGLSYYHTHPITNECQAIIDERVANLAAYYKEKFRYYQNKALLYNNIAAETAEDAETPNPNPTVSKQNTTTH